MKVNSNRFEFPLLRQLKQYQLSNLGKDLNAGIAVAVLLIPQGLAYALLSGMPPIYGLYAAMVPVLLYALMGTSNYLQVGPVAISSILVFQGVSLIAEPFSPELFSLSLPVDSM